jgi:hypothetical protein
VRDGLHLVMSMSRRSDPLVSRSGAGHPISERAGFGRRPSLFSVHGEVTDPTLQPAHLGGLAGSAAVGLLRLDAFPAAWVPRSWVGLPSVKLWN